MRKLLLGAGIGAATGLIAEVILLGTLMTIISILLSDAERLCVYVDAIVSVSSCMTIGGGIGGMINQTISSALELRRATLKGASIGTAIGLVAGLIIFTITKQ